MPKQRISSCCRHPFRQRGIAASLLLGLAAAGGLLPLRPGAAGEPNIADPAHAAATAGESVEVAVDALPAPKPRSFGEIRRLHVLGDYWLGSQPAAEDFLRLREAGIRTVINLRHEEESPLDDRQAAAANGLEYVNIPWDGPEELTDAVFDRVRQALRDQPRPILLYCSSANRVGAVWAAFRSLDEGVPPERAIEEGRAVGIRTPEYAPLAEDYIRRRRGE